MDLEKTIKDNEKPLLKSLQEALKIKSVQSQKMPQMPFGKGPAMALEHILNLAKEMGLRTKNLDNYVGWAEWGQGDEMIGILVHLDVVPAGLGWTYPPYGGQIHDGKIYGRGALDDKGPALAALYALKILKDANIDFKRRVRVIFGTNEETSSECIKYYIKHDEIPTMGFSPDANYPIINGEKGILTFQFEQDFKVPNKKISLEGGQRPNMVPEYAEAYILGSCDTIIKSIENFKINNEKINIEYEILGDKIVIKSFGVSAHGSTPEKGTNAIMQLIFVLSELDMDSEQKVYIDFLKEKIGFDTTGKNLDIDFYDDISGKLSFNVGMCHIDVTKAKTTINIRYPLDRTGEEIIENIRENTPENIKIRVLSDSKPHYVPEDNLIIQKLKKAYEKVTGSKAYCFSIGGGTYARLFENCVAFGPVFPGKPELAHEKDEYIEIEDLFKNLKIYTYVLAELIK